MKYVTCHYNKKYNKKMYYHIHFHLTFLHYFVNHIHIISPSSVLVLFSDIYWDRTSTQSISTVY